MCQRFLQSEERLELLRYVQERAITARGSRQRPKAIKKERCEEVQGDLIMHLDKKEEAEETWQGTLLGAQLEMHFWKDVLHGRVICL